MVHDRDKSFIIVLGGLGTTGRWLTVYWLCTQVSLLFGGGEYLQDTDLTVQVFNGTSATL